MVWPSARLDEVVERIAQVEADGAVGPAMLRLAGEHADGTVPLMAGVRTVAEHIVPTIGIAAAAAMPGGVRGVHQHPVLPRDARQGGCGGSR
ncbi:hypothetical protein C8K36_101759 [Rhodococcus sp. OK519]|nr:hypothetical protein C8K36_101759 [Rhodococcus sp. OK519]